MSEVLPRPDHQRILDATPRRTEVAILAAGTRITRLHRLGGPHQLRWGEFRTWGPTTSRFDHHPDPAGNHLGRGILYAATGKEAFTTVLAETFSAGQQVVGPIDRSDRRPAITVFELVAELRLLRLEGGWVTRAGGNQAICSGVRETSRLWAREIYGCYPDLDGVSYVSSVWGQGVCVALWERAGRALPARPIASRTLDDPAMFNALAAAAFDLGVALL